MRLWALGILPFLAVACAGGTPSPAAPGTDAAADGGGHFDASVSPDGSATGCPLEANLRDVPPAAAAGTVLRRFTAQVAGVDREVVLLRLPTADGRETYAEWIPPLGTAAQPAVLMTMPYDGIDWTEREVDARWSKSCTAPPCFLPDVDGPNAPANVGGITYTPLSPAAFVEQAGVHLAQGAGVLGVFGRFYAGGSWWQYAQAMVAGLRFLGTDTRVDPTRIGTIGGSLGGYESFYAAAFAPPGLRPKAVVAYTPPVDLAGEEDWVLEQGPALAKTVARKKQFEVFFDPYLRRAALDVGGIGKAGDYRCFAPSFVVPKVEGDVLVVQDDWDLLVAPSLARSLIARLGSRGHALWYLHNAPPDVDALPLDHGPFDELPQGAPAAVLSRDTFAMAFLHLRIGRGVVYAPYHQATLVAFLTRLRDQTRAGIGQPGAAERLADLADPRVVFFEATTKATSPGPDSVAAAVNAVWGVSLGPAAVQSYLRTNGLPP